MKPCVAAVGTFDGVHLGHKAIAGEVLRVAAERNIDSRIVTFLNHPLSVIAPSRCPSWITSRDISEHRLTELGIGRVSFMRFTPELARMTAMEFMKCIKERFNVAVLVMGYDNTFGSDRLKSHDDYVAAGREAGIEVTFVDRVSTADGNIPSSSAVRHAIADGDIDRIFDLTDQELIIEGTVVKGKRNGHKLGFPTMNIDVDGLCRLREGVYAAVYFPDPDDITDDYTAVLSVGRNPTVADGNPVTYELHVPGVDLGDMYGTTARFVVGPRLRDIMKFDSLAELKKAIRADIRAARGIFG